MNIRTALSILAIGLATLSGCASVPMATQEKDAVSKTFAAPPVNQAGLYVYRNSSLGAALRKTVSIDGAPIGKTAPNTYFHRVINPGAHTLSTESEFGDNAITFDAVAGKNYFARQYIKMGVFVGGSGIEIVSEQDGKAGVLETQQAQ
jgi:hypothetical protein